jgi:hypothetical protein
MPLARRLPTAETNPIDRLIQIRYERPHSLGIDAGFARTKVNRRFDHRHVRVPGFRDGACDERDACAREGGKTSVVQAAVRC